MSTDTDRTTITDIHTVGIPVSDQASSLDFYVEKLGFEKRLDAAFGEARWIEVAPAHAGTSIALVPAHEGAPIGVDTGIRLSTRDAESAHVRLLAGGVDVDSEVIRMGESVPPMFALRDPDGNRLVIVERASAGFPRSSEELR